MNGPHVYVLYLQPMKDTSFHANLVNAVLTGLSCNDIGCVLAPLLAIF